MIDQRAALLDRCLRLEARLLGVAVDPPPEADYAALPPVPTGRQRERRRQRKVTPADIAQMRDLRSRGLSYRAIAQRVACADSTVRLYVHDVQVPR